MSTIETHMIDITHLMLRYVSPDIQGTHNVRTQTQKYGYINIFDRVYCIQHARAICIGARAFRRVPM